MAEKENLIIDDGQYEWEEVFQNLKIYFKEITCKKTNILEIYNDLVLQYNFLYETIHEKLYKYRELEENEQNIRLLVKYVIIELLPFITKKMYEFQYEVDKQIRKNGKNIEEESSINENANLLKMIFELEDNLYALASFRSMVHYAHYMERGDDNSQLVWKYNMEETMGSIFHYSNSMVLDKKYEALVKQCPTGYGKCFQENEMVLTSTGYKYAKDVKVNDLVYSMKDNEVVLKRVVDKWYSKKKQIKIKTRNGIEIIVSPEHRMFTQRGYIEAKEITKDDYLYHLCSPLNYGKDIDENEMKFISMMIFDGSCSGENIQFSKPFYTEIYKEFMKVCDELHFGYNNYTCKDRDCNILSIRKNEDRPKELLEKYGLYGYYSTNKRLPQEFFAMSLKQRYEFIGIMLATDGYIPKYSKNGGNNVGITLSNKELCKDIQLLMSTCGIYSNLSYKRSKINEKMFDSWVLTIPDEFIEVIYKNCYCYQKQDSLIERYEYINNLSIKVYSNSVNYPKEVLKDCKEFKKIVNKQWTRNKTFKREIVHKYINDKNIISNDFYWNRIVDIECNNEETTMIDFEIEETHNFIANGLVSHNSKSDCVIITYCFGIDVNDDIMKVVGNKNLVKPITTSIVRMMCSERFAKVFPTYKKYNCKESLMFKECAKSEGSLTLADTKKGKSFICLNKETSIDGGRYNRQFYDDITQSDDMENVSAHASDNSRYEKQWKTRIYDEFSCTRWFTGTAYHKEDFISTRRKEYQENKTLVNDKNTKNKKWNKFVKINQSKSCIYITIPKLADLDKGEDKAWCTFPQKYSKASALKDLHSTEDKKRRFYAMEQQTPLPPQTLAFDNAYLEHYHTLRPKEEIEECVGIIDPNRKGRDNYACLIFKKYYNDEKYYLVDCFYRKVTIKYALPIICEKISYHLVDLIIFEENTTDGYLLKKEINTETAKFGYTDYKIKSIYSSRNKEEKINLARDDIKDKIVFPAETLFNYDSDMGRCMKDINDYSFARNYKGNDDSIDCCAIFANHLKIDTKNSISAIDLSFKKNKTTY